MSRPGSRSKIRLPDGRIVRRVVVSNSSGHWARIDGKRVQLVRATADPDVAFQAPTALFDSRDDT